jgi:hypothetical protein
VELAKNASSIEELQSIIAERLQLFRMTERELGWSGVKEAEGRDWLKKTFAAINLGNDPTLSLPARMTVTVPFAIMPGSPFEIEVIDTKGIDGAATRPDIQAALDDARCVPVLCTSDGYGAAPTSREAFLAQERRYAPDLNDGARVNIAPLQRAGLLAAEVLAAKDMAKAIADRAQWRMEERRWCREGKLSCPGWWLEGVAETKTSAARGKETTASTEDRA